MLSQTIRSFCLYFFARNNSWPHGGGIIKDKFSVDVLCCVQAGFESALFFHTALIRMALTNDQLWTTSRGHGCM